MPSKPLSRARVGLTFGLGLLLFANPAHAGQTVNHGDAFVPVYVATGLLNGVFGLGILMLTSLLGRRGTPVARWKLTVAVLGIVLSSLCTLWNLGVTFAVVIVLIVATTRSTEASAVVAVLGLTVVPLVVSISAIVSSARLYGRNENPPPPQYPSSGY